VSFNIGGLLKLVAEFQNWNPSTESARGIRLHPYNQMKVTMN